MNNAKVLTLTRQRDELEKSLAEIQEKLAHAKREAEDYVDAEEALDILASFSELHGRLAFPRFLPAIKTLVALRPEPDNESDIFLTWASGPPGGSVTPDEQFSVSLDRGDGEILLNDDYDQAAHGLNANSAELLGSRLLAAAAQSRKLPWSS